MKRWSALLALVASAAVGTTLLPGGAEPPAKPAAAPSPEEERERQVMERFLGVLEKNPRRGTALDRVYGYHVERGSLDELLGRYRKRVKDDPKEGVAWMVLGLLESQRGKDAAAVAAFKEADAAQPDNALASYYVGQALVLVGQPDAAAEAFERALTRKPARTDLLDIFQALGRVYQRAHKNEKAIEVWNRLEKLFPDDPRVQEQIATTLAEEGQYEQALPRYEALAKSGEDRYRQSLFRLEAAELKVRLGRTPAALADFEGLLGQLNPDSWLYREVRRKIDEVFLRNDDLAGLAKYYEGWVAKHEDDVEAMTRLARTLATQGRSPESQAWLTKALKVAPTNKELRLALIDQLTYAQKYADAAKEYEALDKNDPNNPDTLRDWGRLLLKDTSKPEEERKQAAVAVWRRLTQAKPKDPVTAAQVADLCRSAGLKDEALDLYKKAVELVPDQPQYREYLGEFYHSQKRSDEALATWGEIAAGKNRNAKNLTRLAEVLSGFGYLKEAVAAVADACTLEADDFNLRVRHAELLHQAERFDDALKQLELAAKLAGNAEEAEAALAAQLKNYQATDRLADEVAALQKELDAGKDATAARWVRLARFREANRQLPEATAAVTKALGLDPQSVPALAAAARLHESGGNLLAAAEANRKLAAVDRRYRTEYLTNVAKLEARLGRRDQALQAGRELLDAAPGNPDNYKFYADLCFQLGQSGEGLDSLRRAVRVNPSEPQLVLTLAAALAEQFQTGEAIELYWRAFEKTTEMEGRLNVISRLAELYLQNNQLDRLLERLERERREPGKQREMTICLAQAYHAAGDYGTARLELERLLAQNARDTQLLQQLATLAEGEGDLAAATKFQRQLAQAAPGKETEGKLAQVLVKAGEAEEAGAIWVKLAAAEQEPQRVFQMCDSLLSQGKTDMVLAITGKLLRAQPRDWEALYREGVALTMQDKRGEAARRFQTMLDVHLPDDELGAVAKSKKKQPAGRPAGAAPRRALAAESFPLQERIQNVYELRRAVGLETRGYYGGSAPSTWTPNDFGQARMACLAWQLTFAQRDGKVDEFLKPRREASEKAGTEPRARWDWYYLQVARQDTRETHEVCRQLSQGPDPAARWAYLSSLSERSAGRGRRVVVNTQAGAADATPPLPPEEVDHVLACYQDLRRQRPEWLTQQVLQNVTTELKRAKREEDEERVYRDAVEAAQTPAAVANVLQVAAARGDLDGALKLYDRLEQLQAGSRTSPGYGNYPDPSNALAQCMAGRAEAKAPADVLRILDRYLAAVVRRNQASPPKGSRSASSPGNYNYRIYVAKGRTRDVQIDYPTPNDYYDFGALLLLRNAYELYRQDDLLSDLAAHFRARAGGAAPEERVYLRLGLAYLHWWSGDKEQATQEFARACEAAPQDLDLRLELASLHERQGEVDEALKVVEAIAPLDHTMMTRRETMALRLASLTGNVERARLAAERLFGLRLDAEVQVNLAAQMRQMGMHEAAEAVLSRARRQAGGRTGALVSLMLQYQAQNRPDLAVQVAHQILRRGPTIQFQPYNYGRSGDDGGRDQAVQVLARSGKLQELIDRAEAQLKNAPKSFQLCQVLAEYYKADGKRDKAKEMTDRMVALRPDDAKLRYTIATQLAQSGDHAGACDHYLAALRKEPSLYMYRYWEIFQTFQQANRFADLAKLFDEIDVRNIGYYWSVMEVVQNLFNDEKTKEQGMRLFKKAWNAFPQERAWMLGNLYRDDMWNQPEIYDYVRQAIVPGDNDVRVEAWAGVDQIMSWGGDGRINTLLGRLVETAVRQNKLDGLTREVEQGVGKLPDWGAGKALLAVLDLRRGKTAAARTLVRELLDDKKNPMPVQARWALAQECENFAAMQDLVLRLHESAVDGGMSDQNTEFSYSPARRLIVLYRRAGRLADARALCLRYAKADVGYDYDPGYASYRRISALSACAGELVQLGFPVDAVRFYSEILSDAERLDQAARWNGEEMREQVRQGLANAMKGLKPETLPQAVQDVLTDQTDSKGPGPLVDPLLVIQERNLPKASLTSMLETTLKAACADAEQRATVKTRVADLLKAHPDDLSVQVAAALAAVAENQPEAIKEAVDRLAKCAEATPLEELPPGTRANARQRGEAAKQLGLWLVARACYPKDELRPAAVKLGDRALEAARRQKDQVYALAILREWGQLDLDRGDRKAAEQRWGQMLELVVPPPAKKEKTEATPAGSFLRDAAMLLLVAQAGAAVPPPPAPAAAVTSARPGTIPVVTNEQFGKAVEIATLAADQGMPGLSLRAVREALRGGPPVQPGASAEDPRAPRIAQPDQANASATVQERLHELDAVWRRRQIPAAEVYEALAACVLPEARPAELFVYPRPLGSGDLRQPASVGRMLAVWAVQAGKADDLRKRIEARQNQPLAEVPARVLLAQLALAGKDDKLLAECLDWLYQRLQKDQLQNTAELACHAALPALHQAEQAGPALPVVEKATKNLVAQLNDDVGSNLMLALARYHLEHNNLAEGKKQLEEYQAWLLRQAIRNGGNYEQFQQFQNMAQEYVRAGLTDEALDLIGKYVDALTVFRSQEQAPNLGGLAAGFARQLCALPAAERYDRLKGWTLPTATRKSVRFVAAFVPDDAPPTVFVKLPPLPRGVVSSAGLLVDAARECGKLDELAAAAQEAADQKVKNADTLLALVQLAHGRDQAAEGHVKQVLDAVRKPPEPAPPSRYGEQRQKPIDWGHYLVARACLQNAKLRGPGEEIARKLIERAQQLQDHNMLVHLRHDLAQSALANEGTDLAALRGPLDPWLPAVHQPAGAHQNGTPPTLWASHGGLVAHVAGTEQDYLYYPYPLTGTFEISVDCYVGAWAESVASYGGLVCEPYWYGGNGQIWPVGAHETVYRQFRYMRTDAFNRITIQVEPGKVRYLANGRLFYEDKAPSPTSPFFALFTRRERQTAWRNCTVRGKPEVPREVALTHADRLDGWVSSFYGESQPNRRNTDQPDPRGRYSTYRYGVMMDGRTPSPARPEDNDWHAKDGVLHGRRLESYLPGDPMQSRLYYHRPLRDGESVSYEFRYEPGTMMVHPALDRLTFLLEPGGVRLHWMTDGSEPDWTGLKADNVADEPGARSGPSPLPLKPGDWNAVKLAAVDGNAVLELNGVKVYECKLPVGNDRLFGLFHWKDRTAVQVRGVVLKGDWPEALTAQQMGDLFAQAQPSGRARAALVGETFIAATAEAVLAEARALPPAERYAKLLNWVLPPDGPAAFRLHVVFTPADPAPPATKGIGQTGPRGHVGGELDAPALELVAAAKEAGKLDELDERVQKAGALSDQDRRSQLALLCLVRAAQENDGDAADALKRLQKMLAKLPADTPMSSRWPELVAAVGVLGRPALVKAALPLLNDLNEECNQAVVKNVNFPGKGEWERRVRNARALALVAAQPEGQRRPFGGDPRLAYWSPVTQMTAQTRANGYAPAHWTARDGAFTHYPGHGQDYLYFGVPLRGNFEVSCELTSFGWREAHLSYAGQTVAIKYTKKSFSLSQFGRFVREIAIDPELPNVGDWYKYRLVVQDGSMTAYVNDRKIYETALSEAPDPWLALHAEWSITGGIRNLTISGNPVVPDSLELTGMPDLSGWLAGYYDESAGSDGSNWEKRGEEIYAQKYADYEGSRQESVLQYHRPLLEDGELEYEFWYEPGKVLVHPALDRLALLLADDGVKVHWLTDGQYDRGGRAADNATVEKENRRGPDKLPLKAKEWNRLKLALGGDKLTVSLNGVEVYQRALEETNQRFFGLFHFADETEVRVRNVVYRGQWPRKLPANEALLAPAGEGKP